MTTNLIEMLARLALMLRDTAQEVQYHRGDCPVSLAYSKDFAALAEEIDDFSLAIDCAEQQSPRH